MALKPRPGAQNGDSVSLNKYIADTGFCSRREADDYILQARVTINDSIALPGNRVQPGDVVEIDGEPVGKRKATIYIAYHKPGGVTSTTDRADKTNIIDAIGHKERIFPVGRLDKDSEGLIFLTNDGNIVNKILRAGNAHEKEYIVTLDKPMNQEFVQAMGSGVRILQTITKPCKVTQEGKTVFRITLIQGLNRQIRRMCEALGFKVTRLKRVRIMNVHLGSLKTGHWRYLTAEEQAGLQRMVATSAGDEHGARVKEQQVKMPAQKTKAADKKKPEAPAPRKSAARKPSSFKEFRQRRRS